MSVAGHFLIAQWHFWTAGLANSSCSVAALTVWVVQCVILFILPLGYVPELGSPASIFVWWCSPKREMIGLLQLFNRNILFKISL